MLTEAESWQLNILSTCGLVKLKEAAYCWVASPLRKGMPDLLSFLAANLVVIRTRAHDPNTGGKSCPYARARACAFYHMRYDTDI